MKLIDKDALVAEIERKIKGLKDCHADTVEGYAGEISGLKRLLSFISTLEVKEEVDLEKEIDLLVNKLHTAPGYEELCEFARHFYELGHGKKNKL